MPSSSRLHFLWVVIAFNLSLQVPLSAEEFTLKDKATGKIQATFSSTTGMLKLGETRYSVISEKGDPTFLLVGDEKGVLKTYGPFAWSNGTECVIGGVAYVLAKDTVQGIKETGTKASTADRKESVVTFLLNDPEAGMYHGPFEFRDSGNGYSNIKTGTLEFSTSNGTNFSVILYEKGIRSQFGPYSLTNHAPARIGNAEMSVLVGDEAGQTYALLKIFKQALAQGDNKIEKTVSMMSDGIKANPKSDGMKEAIALRDKYAKEWELNKDKYKKGLVRHKDGWVTVAESDALLAKQKSSTEEAERLNDTGNELLQDGRAAEAITYFRKAADGGSAWAANNLGVCYLNGNGVRQDDAEGVKWFMVAAKQGLAQAQSSLGQCYLNGNGVGQDTAKAARWFELSAKQDNADGQYFLGFCYLFEKGVAKDSGEAAKWFLKAAEQGQPDAQCGIGLLYYDGEGVPKNYQEAAAWLLKAANQGSLMAQKNLIHCYAEGTGVPKSSNEALKWTRKAAAQGDEEAKGWLRTWESR